MLYKKSYKGYSNKRGKKAIVMLILNSKELLLTFAIFLTEKKTCITLCIFYVD